MSTEAVAVFQGPKVEGYVLFRQHRNGTVVSTHITKMPPGEHGFHIHKAGDLRGEGCKAACDHWHKGRPTRHGGPPTSDGPRHTGDLGNIEMPNSKVPLQVEYLLRNIKVDELYGRSIIVHADPDDLGLGGHEDSQTTGHSGARIGCAIIGRVMPSCAPKAVEAMTDMKGGMIQAYDPMDTPWAPIRQTRKNSRK